MNGKVRDKPVGNRFVIVAAGILALSSMPPASRCWAQTNVTAVPAGPETEEQHQWIASGRVLDSITRAPVSKAAVTLAPQNPSNLSGAQSAVTDQEGAFRFTGRGAGHFRLFAERRNFLKGEYGSRGPGRPGLPVHFDPGQRTEGLDILLTPPGAISGRVFDEEGEPLAHIPVQVITQHYRRGRKEWMPAMIDRTNDRGEYRAHSLKPGRYAVLVQSFDLASSASTGPRDSSSPEPALAYGVQYFPSGPEFAQAEIIEVGPGLEVRGIDLTLRKIRVYRIRGRVEWPAGEGGSGGTLLVASTAGTARLSVPLRSDGRFELNHLPPGTYSLSARGSLGIVPVAAQATLHVTDSNIEDLVLGMSSGYTVTGRVVFSVGSGADRPAVTVELIGQEGLIAASASARVDPNGRFAIQGVVPGRYRLETASSSKAEYVASVTLDGVAALDKDLEIQGPASLTIAMAADSGTVSGDARVGDAPVAGVTVALVPSGRRRSIPTYYRFATTGTDGRYLIDGAVPGGYQVFAFADIDPSDCYDLEFLRRYESRATKLTVTRGGSHTLTVEPMDLQPVQVR